ncbi:hypothetical protein OUZ56_032951 [Daphnia magna]|uniref:Uncharacterized protein n=1 Tax=Daphnia magna TaxID=35525 RepID=A0ABQ9ZXA3_9CRUS|nr:hypothetical protein OUZ56_032951 [Daphnia magna]
MTLILVSTTVPRPKTVEILDIGETGTFKVFLDLWEEPILRDRWGLGLLQSINMLNNRLLVIIVGVMSSVMIDGLEGQTRPLMSHFSQKQLSRFPDKDY